MLGRIVNVILVVAAALLAVGVNAQVRDVKPVVKPTAKVEPAVKPTQIAKVLIKQSELSSLAEMNGQVYGAGKGTIALIGENGSITSTVPVKVSQVAGLAPFKSGQLLLGDGATNTVFTVDPKSGATTKLLSLSDISPQDDPAGVLVTKPELASLAFDGSSMYVGVSAGYSSSIYKIDPNTKKVLAHAYSPGPDPDAMQFIDGKLFVVTNRSTQLRSLTPTLDVSNEMIQLPPGKSLLLKGNKIQRIPERDTNITPQPIDISKIKVAPVRANLPTKVSVSSKAIELAKELSAALSQPQKYAVLICGDVAESGYNEFWNDTLWMYKTLLNSGYTPERIFVLYGYGNDHISANPKYKWSGTVTDFPATIVWVNKVFDGLKNGDATNGIPKMKDNDTLFVWTFDHGGGGNPATLCLRDGSMLDTQFAAKLNAVPYATRAIFMQQCRSGGFIDDLKNSKTFIYTACKATENAHRSDTENEYYNNTWYCHGEFNYHITCALSGANCTGGAVNADSNNNGKVSAKETASWNTSHESQSETPQMDDSGNIGSGFYCK